MIALTLSAPLVGLALMLSMQWFEDRLMTSSSAANRVDPHG
jgi:hypothetical protein